MKKLFLLLGFVLVTIVSAAGVNIQAPKNNIDSVKQTKEHLLDILISATGIQCGDKINKCIEKFGKGIDQSPTSDEFNRYYFSYGYMAYKKSTRKIERVVFQKPFDGTFYGVSSEEIIAKLGDPDNKANTFGTLIYRYRGLYIQFDCYSTSAFKCDEVRLIGFDGSNCLQRDIELPANSSVEKNKSTSMFQDNGFAVDLPPILSIQDISFSKNALMAGENATLSLRLKNVGAGDANGVYISLASDLTGLKFPAKTNVPVIAKSGGTQIVNIELNAGLDIPTSEAAVKIEIVEPNFKQKIQGKQVKFPTKEFLKPEMLLAKFAVLENLSANPNNQIDINEQVDVKLAIQNVGQGNAENVNVSVTNTQAGVMLLGVVDQSGNMARKNPVFSSIASGNFETITYRYFINSEFTASQLSFTISATEKIGKYSLTQVKSVDINKVLQEEGYIRTVAANSGSKPTGKVVVEDIPDFISDVDENIPVNEVNNDKTFAVVIGNENYAKEIKVSYALNDARIFKQYLQKTLGLPANNIHYDENATYGQILDALKWVSDVTKAYNGQAKLIFYYAGHGMPDEQTKSAYILPVDGNSTNMATSIKLADVYSKLSEHPAQSVSVFLDACFSGATRETTEAMLVEGRSVKIKPKSDALTGNTIVFSATTGEETALPFKEKQHGMFTYYLLKKLKESKGNITMSELSSAVITNVSQQSLVINKKSQTPQVNHSTNVDGVWGGWKVK